MIWSFEMENSWILEIVKTLVLFIGGIFGGIGAGIYADYRSRKNRHLIEFESAVRSEIQSLNRKSVDLDGFSPLKNWHSDSIRRLKPHVDYMKKFDQKRWEKIAPRYNEYLPPSNAPDTDLARRFGYGIDQGFLMEKLINLLNSIAKTYSLRLRLRPKCCSGRNS